MARRKIEDREALEELHVRLHAEGKLSLRQIADLTGVNHETVRRDLARWLDRQLGSLSQSVSHNTPECDSTPMPNATAREPR